LSIKNSLNNPTLQPYELSVRGLTDMDTSWKISVDRENHALSLDLGDSIMDKKTYIFLYKS
jgi:hypothetical protein